MRVIVAFESMYGNTHQIATAIASGFEPTDNVTVLPVRELADGPAPDVLVVGMPTHGHGLPRPGSRRTAIDSARSAHGDLTVEPTAAGSGVREWLPTLTGPTAAGVAAFDTRFRAPGWLAGHPARRVLRRLVEGGARQLAPAESYYIDKSEHLRAGELDRARQWGTTLRQRAAEQFAGTFAPGTDG